MSNSIRVHRGGTFFPNHLLDELMPTLKDTEWRVLCVIVRTTLGWRQGEARKARDWLTQSQLKRRTGRETEALSSAIDGLVRKALIEVTDAKGEVLLTPASRRRHTGRLYYRLSPRALDALFPQASGDEASSKSELKASHPTSESEHRKANTTKQTLTKYVPYGRETTTNKREKPQSELTPTANPDVRRLIILYCKLFRAHSTRGEPPPVNWGRDGKLAKRLLQLYPYERLAELLERFLESPDDWSLRQGLTLPTFQSALPRLLLGTGGTESHIATPSFIGK